jgi:hypothetical protein
VISYTKASVPILMHNRIEMDIYIYIYIYIYILACSIGVIVNAAESSDSNSYRYIYESIHWTTRALIIAHAESAQVATHNLL